MKNRPTLLLFSLVLAVVFISCDKKSKVVVQKEEKLSIVKVTDTTLIDGVLLELIDNNGKAELKVHSDAYTLTGELKINPPCYFLRWTKGKVENFSYPEVGVQHTLGILGDILSPEEKKQKRVEGNKICGNKVQGLVFKKDSISLTNKMLNNIYCREVGADEKNFWDFAHRGMDNY